MSVLGRLLRRDSDEVVIETMRRKHVATIMPIERRSYPRPWSTNVFASELELARRGERTYLVARLGAEVIGYAGAMYALEDAHVTNIAVAPEHRRSGVATRLLAELTWIAIERGCTAQTLEVRVSNTAAQEMYRTFGFVPAGVRQRYYENVEDAIVMWCTDIAGESHAARLRELCPEAVR